MAINCPRCETRTLFSESELGSTGRLVQCPRCGTTWLARHFDVDVYGPAARREPPPAARQPTIIEGKVVTAKAPPARPARQSVRPTAMRGERAMPRDGTAPRGRAFGRYGFAAGATMLVLTLIAVVLLTPAVSALPWLGGVLGAEDGIALRAVQSRTLTLRGSAAILVEGELFNSSDREIEVPAVRISLRSDEAELYSWTVEPSRKRVAAGATIGFRSALADPPSGADQIALSLAPRTAAPNGGR